MLSIFCFIYTQSPVQYKLRKQTQLSKKDSKDKNINQLLMHMFYDKTYAQNYFIIARIKQLLKTIYQDQRKNPVVLRERLLHFLACSLLAPDLIFYRIILHTEVIVYQADLACL